MICRGVHVGEGVARGALAVAVGARVGTGVLVAVGVRVAIGACVAVGVAVAVGTGVNVCVGVPVAIFVAVGVLVNVSVGAGVAVTVGVSVAVGVLLGIGVLVGEGSAVFVGVAVLVAVEVGVSVGTRAIADTSETIGAAWCDGLHCNRVGAGSAKTDRLRPHAVGLDGGGVGRDAVDQDLQAGPRLSCAVQHGLPAGQRLRQSRYIQRWWRWGWRRRERWHTGPGGCRRIRRCLGCCCRAGWRWGDGRRVSRCAGESRGSRIGRRRRQRRGGHDCYG